MRAALQATLGSVAGIALMAAFLALARHGSQVACAFHPELADDTRIHGLFLSP